MKKILILIAMLAMVTPLIEAKTNSYYPGKIRYKNGDTEEYLGILIPSPDATTVTITNDPKHKEKDKIDTREIFSIDLWHKDHSDKVGHLYPIVINKGKGTVVRICLLEHASNWGAVLELADYYYIDKKGQLYGVVISTNNAPPTIRHYLVRNGEEKGTLLFTNRSWNPRRAAAAEHFAENPDIAERINSGKLKTTDINYILDAMDSGSGNIARSDDDDEEDARPAKKSTASSSHKSKSNGFDNDYEMHSALRLDYVNFFSSNQRIMLGYEWYKSVIIAGANIGAIINNELKPSYEDAYMGDYMMPMPNADTIPVLNTTLGVGVVLGVRFPIQLGDYYLIPRVYVNPTLTPISLLKKDSYAKMAVDIPICAGLDFAIPVSEYAINIGLSFAYDLSVYAEGGQFVQTKENSKTFRRQLTSSSLASLFGQPGLGVHVAFCW